MPRLTQVLYGKKPIKKFSNYKYLPIQKEYWPMTLRDHVASTSDKKKGLECQIEMSEMLVCLQKNNLDESACQKDIERFYKCWNNFKEKFAKQKEEEMSGYISKGGRMNSRQVNELLKKHPHPTT